MISTYLYAILTVFSLSIFPHAACTLSESLVLRDLENSLLRRKDCPINKCGRECGNCAADECCSAEGWCGKSKAYCAAPECKFDFGPACDANRAPSGVSTIVKSRATYANGIPYGGVGIFHCTVPGTVAITYDDGPSEFSTKLLDLFDQYNGKATFFINGNNKGRGMIDDPATGWPAIIQRMYKQGHQVASHTWSHQSLDAITGQQRQNQIVYNEIAFGNILGLYPTYMRPPYSQCSSECQTLMEDLGYHVINFDVDIEDAIDHPDLQASIKDFSGNLTSKSDPTNDNLLVIGHEINSDTVHKITEIMLKSLNAKGFKAVTVGDCLDDPKSNWYRYLDGSLDPAPPPKPKTTSKPSVSTSTSASPKAASAGLQQDAKNSTADSLNPGLSTQSDSKTAAQSSSPSQTHPAIASKASSTGNAVSAKSVSSATSLLIGRGGYFLTLFVGMVFDCVL